MKKWISMIVCAILLFSFSACGGKNPIQEATGATKEQSQAIEAELKTVGIDYEIVNEAKHNKPETPIPDSYKLYNVIDKDGKNYFMALDGNMQVGLLLDSEEKVLSGNLLPSSE